MKRKITIGMMVIGIALLALSSLAAEGIQEQQEPLAPGYGARLNYSPESVEVTGTVELTAAGIELKAADGEEYELMYPRFLAEDVEIESGDTISVEGFLVPGPRWGSEEDEQHLRVEKVTIDDEEYDLSRIGYAPGMRGGYGMSTGPAYPPRGGAYGPGANQPQRGYGGTRGPGRMGRPTYCW